MKRAAWICVGCFVLSSLTFGRPGEGIRYRNFAVSPFVDLSATYDSNVFLAETGSKDDIYLDIVPGIAFINRTDQTILRQPLRKRNSSHLRLLQGG